jgi:selenide, water dikinase
VQHPKLLVGFHTGDDAAVYQLTDDLCVIQTLDFFPPIVDDAYDYGAIAAVNALSDIYAMGGTPILALNIVCFPEDLDVSILGRILQGGSDVAVEAGVLIAGGHTVKDAEPKYGMAVTGIIAPNDIVTNAGAKPGDILVLTQPIGTGIVSTAGKAGIADPADMAAAVAAMRTSNKPASEAMVAVGVNSATDVTGFGLTGHLGGMMKASDTTARLSLAAIPLLPGVRELADRAFSGGTRRNHEASAKVVRWHGDLTLEDQLILCDAQTSGGLVLSVASVKADALVADLAARGVTGVVIGDVVANTGVEIEVGP